MGLSSGCTDQTNNRLLANVSTTGECSALVVAACWAQLTLVSSFLGDRAREISSGANREATSPWLVVQFAKSVQKRRNGRRKRKTIKPVTVNYFTHLAQFHHVFHPCLLPVPIPTNSDKFLIRSGYISKLKVVKVKTICTAALLSFQFSFLINRYRLLLSGGVESYFLHHMRRTYWPSAAVSPWFDWTVSLSHHKICNVCPGDMGPKSSRQFCHIV